MTTEKTKLVTIDIMSCYFSKDNVRLKLPSRMAWCTPRMKTAIEGVRDDVEAKGGKLILSDLYRSSDMQAAAHKRYLAGRAEWEAKGKAGAPPKYSPASGFSFHEAGEAMDVDLRALLPIAGGVWSKVLDVFWPIAKARGFRPVINTPNEGQSESWHFDFWDSEREEIYKAAQAKDKTGYRTAAAAAVAQRIAPY